MRHKWVSWESVHMPKTSKTHIQAMWSSPYLCKQRERREDEVQRGNPLFKCQAVRAILSLLVLFPLFSVSNGSHSAPWSLLRCLSCVRACGRACANARRPRERWHGPLLSLCHQNLPTGEKKNESRMHAGVKRWLQLQGGADGKTQQRGIVEKVRRWPGVRYILLKYTCLSVKWLCLLRLRSFAST